MAGPRCCWWRPWGSIIGGSLGACAADGAVSTLAPSSGYALPQAHWRLYLALTKPRVVALIVFTAIVGTLMSTPGMPPLSAMLWGNLGIALASASAAAINHVLDRRIDAQM